MGDSIRKTGPRTKRGKAASKMNAIAHGVTALAVPPAEQSAFKVHRASFIEAYSPANAVEAFLVDRIVMTAWRMRRLDAWEAFQLEADRRKAFNKAIHPDSGGDLVYMLAMHERGKSLRPAEMTMPQIRVEVEVLTEDEADAYLTSHEQINDLERQGEEESKGGAFLVDLDDPPTASQCAPLSKSIGPESNALWGCAYAFHDALLGWEVEPATIARAILDREPTDDEVQSLADPLAWQWEPEEFGRLWELVAVESGKAEDREAPVMMARSEGYKASHKGRRMVALARQARTLLSEAEQGALVPQEFDHAKFHRYDAGLERSLFKAMHELEALQEKRRGGVAPLARVEVHGGADSDG